MTILASLEQLYHQMAVRGEAPKPGFSIEHISFAVVLDAAGMPLRLADKRSHLGKKPTPVQMAVPAGNRTSGIKPNLLWDKTAYVFGVIALESKDEDGKKILIPAQSKRTADEHAAFVQTHLDLLEGNIDPGLMALRSFVERWQPEDFKTLGFNTDALDQNIVFEFDDDTGQGFIHARPAAAQLLAVPAEAKHGLCLVTGDNAPIERLHPKIKGVIGAQSAGASLISFNSEAYESYGKTQGKNAPVSEAAVFAYGSALNALLASGSRQRFRIADTTVVFWAASSDAAAVDVCNILLGQVFDPPDEQDAQNELRTTLMKVAKGQTTGDPSLDPQARVFMLGLAPNAARLSVRFWHSGTFGDFARNILALWDDLNILPVPWRGLPVVRLMLYETALFRNAETIAPLLGGQVMRAILSGQPLPHLLLSFVIRRIRADGDINGRRAAICKAIINRTTKQEVIPASLDPENMNPAYRLGRVFAMLERAQSVAMPGLKVTVKDRYFATASAMPARMFPLLYKKATHHLELLKKGEKSGIGHWLDKELGNIWLGLDPDMPRVLSLEDQGRFVVGFYHQRWTKSTQKKGTQ